MPSCSQSLLPRILHKTDVGGVKLDIRDIEELREAYRDFKERPPRESLLVDEMMEKSV
ncbi:MAG TPA: hypothetical protein ENG62_02705 [Thermoplasmatales archaeon]|nr:hypothetical protein [Thermoplasmatales archaeon]